jgi:GTPase SAR1 family protein
MVNQKALKILVGNKTDIRDHGVTISAVKERDAKLKIEQELRCKYF